MPRKSMQELLAQVASTMPDNTTGAITPAIVRQMFTDFIQAIAPAYGNLTITNPSAKLTNIAPAKLTPYAAAADSDATQTTSSADLGEITRANRGTSFVNFGASFECPAGRLITFTLYKNGAPTAWRSTVAGGGAGNLVAVAFTAPDYADPAAVYSIWMSAEVNATTVTVSGVSFLLSVEPVNSYV